MSKQAPKGEMPFLDHLEELRMRLFWSVGTLAVCTMIAFALVWNYPVIDIISAPIQPYLVGGKLIYTHPADPIAIVLKVAFGLGLASASPMLVYQAWAFLSPALHAHEKRVVIPVIAGAFVLFATGAFLAVKFAMPAMFDVLFSFQSGSLTQMITAREYVGFALVICLSFGGAFQLPIVILTLTLLGLVTPTSLAKFRKHAAVGSFVLASVITPGDLIIMTLWLGVPLYGLYEISIVLSWIVHRTRMRRAAAGSIGGAAA